MAISEDNVTDAKEIITTLTWGKIFKIVVLAIISIIFIMAWIFRVELFSTAISKKNLETQLQTSLAIQNHVRDEIVNIVKKDSSIVAIQIVSVNFQKNIRTDVYTYIDDPKLREMYDRWKLNKAGDTPLFDEDKVNNTRLIKLINGEFVCAPYSESTAYKYAPAASAYITDICAIGIPPYYGEFSGILTVYLTKKPGPDLAQDVFLLSRSISLKIYNDNIHNSTDANKGQY